MKLDENKRYITAMFDIIRHMAKCNSSEYFNKLNNMKEVFIKNIKDIKLTKSEKIEIKNTFINEIELTLLEIKSFYKKDTIKFLD